MNSFKSLLEKGEPELITPEKVVTSNYHPSRGGRIRAQKSIREDFALPSIHYDEAKELITDLNHRAFQFTIDVKVTAFNQADERAWLHEKLGTPLYRTPAPRRLDGRRNRIRSTHVERSDATKRIRKNTNLTRKQKNFALRMMTWLFERLDSHEHDVRVVCKGLEVSLWEPLSMSTGTLMIALHPFGMTGDIFDKTAKHEIGITKQQDLTDTIKILKQHGIIIDTATLKSKRRVWQAAPRFAGGNVHCRSALQAWFENKDAAQRAVEDLQREVNIADAAPPFTAMADMPDGVSLDESIRNRMAKG